MEKLTVRDDMKFDFVIVGNGAVGTMTAIKLRERFKNKRICLVGPKERLGSASVAAGAMAAVFAEVEKCCESHATLEQKYLDVGRRSSKLWRNFLSEINNDDIITCEDTIVFLKEGYSNFEMENYEASAGAALNYKSGDYLSAFQIKEAFPYTYNQVNSAFKISGEFSYCTVKLFETLDRICEQQKISFYYENVDEIDTINRHIRLADGEVLSADRIIVAAGAQTASLFENKEIVPMLQGVGTALVIQNISHKLEYLSKYVYRSVNRGGAQCGLHCVPRSDGSLYVGAGNYVTLPMESMHRFETIKYLLDGFGSEVADKSISYSSVGVLCHGYRPRSLDGRPLVGSLKSNENIFVATGTNRVGLTWAPDIANQVLKWVDDKDLDGEYADWQPSREPKSLMSDEEAISYFSESRYAAAIEHLLFDPLDTVQINEKRSEIELAVQKLTKSIKDNSGYKLSEVHPDNWVTVSSIGK